MSSSSDLSYLRFTIEMSKDALVRGKIRPFASIVVMDGAVLGSGFSSTHELSDPSAHAEVLALREASGTMGTPRLREAVVYSSSEPCPMCLGACYSAQVARVVFGATSADVSAAGWRDRWLYEEFSKSRMDRSLPVVGIEELRGEAASVLLDWRRSSGVAPGDLCGS